MDGVTTGERVRGVVEVVDLTEVGEGSVSALNELLDSAPPARKRSCVARIWQPRIEPPPSSSWIRRHGYVRGGPEERKKTKKKKEKRKKEKRKKEKVKERKEMRKSRRTKERGTVSARDEPETGPGSVRSRAHVPRSPFQLRRERERSAGLIVFADPGDWFPFFEETITRIATTDTHTSWLSVAIPVLVGGEGILAWNSEGSQIPPGILMVAPIWPEHPQAYWDCMQPWSDVGRACTYVPLGVYRWKYGEAGLLKIVMEYLGASACSEEKCGSVEYWGESGLRADGTDPTCTPEHLMPLHRRPRSWKYVPPPDSWRSLRKFDKVNPEGYCHRCFWLPPISSPSVYPLYGDVRKWNRSWEHEALRDMGIWNLVLGFLGGGAICSSKTCWRWVNLPGFRKGVGGGEFAREVESGLPLLSDSLGPDGRTWLVGLKSPGLCAWCRALQNMVHPIGATLERHPTPRTQARGLELI